MPSDPITLVRWRDARTATPKGIDQHWTDVGPVWFDAHARDWYVPDEFGSSMDPPEFPSVWCDPTPPDDDALTLDDLRVLLTWAPSRSPEAARLRRAIEAAEGKTP